MEFSNRPQIMNVLRTDCCPYLKGENNQPISIRIKEKCHVSGYLKIQLSLKTNVNSRHFFKLFRLDDKNPKEETSRVTEYRINQSEEEIMLNFFGIRKLKREEAIAFLRKSFNDNIEQIFKDNSSVALLEIMFTDDDGGQIHYLVHEIHVGSPNKEQLIIKYYTPKTICDDGEITIKLDKKIKDDNDNVQLQVIGLNSGYVKKLLQPSKDVLVFKAPLNKIKADCFSARLVSGRNESDLIEFFIRKPEPENFKRKASFTEESCSVHKMIRLSSNCTDSKEVANISVDRRRQVNDGLISKYVRKFGRDCEIGKEIIGEMMRTIPKSPLASFTEVCAETLRKIARVGHDFAFGKEMTKEMSRIMFKLPIVCILKDDVGDTPLNNAILQSNEDRAFYLLNMIYEKYPEEVQSCNSSGHTALILSPACDVSLLFIKKLIDCGSDLFAVDCDGNTAMNIAIQYKKTDVLELLLNEIQKRNMVLKSSRLNLLLKDVLNNEYFDGFELIASHCPIILQSNESEFDENQLSLYKNYVDNFKYFCLNDEIYITPIAENDEAKILDFLLSE